MTRNYLKALGLALIAAFAMSAVIASTASAEDEQGVLTTELGNDVTFTGEEFGEPEENQLTAFGNFTRCPESTYTGHNFITQHETETAEQAEENLEHDLIPNKATTTTITPHYKQAENNCQASTPFGNRPVTVDMTGCDYVFHVGKTTPAESIGTYGLTVDIECPKDKHIDVTVYNDNDHTETLCKLTVTEQTGLTGFHVTNKAASPSATPKDYLQVHGTLHSIHVKREGLCTLDGKGATTNAGEFDANVTVKGDEELGEPEGITISDTRP